MRVWWEGLPNYGTITVIRGNAKLSNFEGYVNCQTMSKWEVMPTLVWWECKLNYGILGGYANFGMVGV